MMKRKDSVGAGNARRWLAITVAGGLLAMAGGGCAAAGKGGGKPAKPDETAEINAPVKPEARYKVVVDGTDFFRISPQQAAGADDHLKKDARVTLLKRYGGYSQIKTAGGLPGYVPSENITRLSAQEIEQEDAALRAQQAPPSALAPTLSGPGGAYAIPPEATRDTVLPVPDASPTPKPTPNSMFRY